MKFRIGNLALALAFHLTACTGTSSPGVPDTLVDVPDASDMVGDTLTDLPVDVATDGDVTDDACTDGQTLCSGECVDTTSDPDHCGSCGNGCDPDEVCSDGTCTLSCEDPLVECDGLCVDLSSDPLNCGECGLECPEGGSEYVNTVPACTDSTCDIACDEGWADLDGEPGCEYPCAGSGEAETCNGVDDDCDGEADEGFDCVFGEAVLCTTDCGSEGSGVCTISCTIPEGASCTPPVETCNGVDDDCDSEADEDFDCVAGDTVSCTTECGGVGSGTCTAECTVPSGADCTAGTETCNGLDDNCNGEVDEDFDCVMDQPTSCTTTCGSTGTGTCSSTCTLPDAASCAPPAETCNGVDDDCDGSSDEDFDCVQGESVTCTTDCGTTGTGLCTDECTVPSGAGCAAGTEICNGVDDDCNGEADDTFDCVRFATVSCTTTCGSTGIGACSATCTLPTETECTPPVETCNGVDDDCDGEADETYSCVQGESLTCTTICGTSGTGVCSSGCSRPSAASCTPPTEICNGLDEDCADGPDNGFDCVQGAPTSCTTTCGSTGTGTCSSACTLPDVSACTPPAEVCNGVDDDCDGSIDEDFDCVQGTPTSCTTTCGSAGTGTCSVGCTLPATWECTPPAETCNGVDDDCNGTADDGAGMECVQGEPTSCTTTCGSAGTGACSSTCTLPDASSCTPPAETCNGVDDDCNGTVDDGAGMECAQGDTGIACTTSQGLAGTADCTSGCILGTCCASSEVCNGVDDDCSGTADDGTGMECVQGATGLACTTGGGVGGTRDCTASCTFTTCCASEEVCGNGWDDDCDGADDGSDPDCACSYNDDCSCPFDITGSGSYSGTTSGAADDFNGGCGSTGGPDVVWEMVITESSNVAIDTNGSSFDTMLSLHSSCGGSVIECDDDGGDSTQSYIYRTLDPGTYYVVVDGYSSGSYGSYALNVNIVPVGAGDTCIDPLTYPWPGTTSGTTSGYANDYSSASCGGGATGADVVYEMVVPSDRTVAVDLYGSSYDTVLHVLASDCMTEVACDDDYWGIAGASYISQWFTAGTYYIVVDGYGSSGSYVLDVSW